MFIPAVSFVDRCNWVGGRDGPEPGSSFAHRLYASINVRLERLDHQDVESDLLLGHGREGVAEAVLVTSRRFGFQVIRGRWSPLGVFKEHILGIGDLLSSTQITGYRVGKDVEIR